MGSWQPQTQAWPNPAETFAGPADIATLMRDSRIRTGSGRPAALAVAILALLLNVLIPPGFMVVGGPTSPLLVICTGHGAVTQSSADLGHPGKAPKDKADHSCPFAGHGGSPLAPRLMSVSLPRPLAAIVRSETELHDLTPGRGLAAPPPPSQGPPVTLS